MELYTAGGRRRTLPPLAFGLGVLVHLARHGRRYDVVHTASFPFFPLLAIAALHRVSRFRVVVDWHEVWTRGYWVEYLGRVGGRIGWAIQGVCLRVPQRAFCFSRLHERRLHDLRVNGEVTRLEGQYDGPPPVAEPSEARHVVVFAGRLIPEKRALAIPPAIARARRELPELEAEIYGDGPDRDRLASAIRDLGLEGVVTTPGFVDAAALEGALSTALCLLLPSSREGYGLVVLEAASRGVPSVVVDGADNAATELVEDGVNGFVASSASAESLAAAIVDVERAGRALRISTVAWCSENAERLSLEHSLEEVAHTYSELASARS
jgi:glycosyltransferase involved in cell wall biosynthesis